MQQEYGQQMFVRQHADPLAGVVSVPSSIVAVPEGRGSLDQALDLSHELRTSLAVVTLVSGNLDRLYERLDDGQRRKMIQDIRRHTHKLNNVIGDLLTLPGDCDPNSI